MVLHSSCGVSCLREGLYAESPQIVNVDRCDLWREEATTGLRNGAERKV